MLKVTIQKWKVRGKLRWAVYRFEGGKFRRSFFASKTDAETEAERLRGQLRAAGEVWLSLPAQERERLMLAYARMQKLGLDIDDLIDRAEAEPCKVDHTLGDSFEKFMAEKGRMLASRKTLLALKSNVGRFIKGRESASLRSVTRDDVLAWLQRDGLAPRTFNTYRTSLNTFFRWCVATEALARSPMVSVQSIGERQMPDLDVAPVILGIEQCKRLLWAALDGDRGLIPYIALGLFAGLRPEREAGKLVKDDIQGDLIHVRGLHAKDRQRRHVEIHPTLKEWLALDGVEYHPHNLRRRFERVREAAGLIKREKVKGKKRLKITFTGWDQDCLRHTFASHYLPAFGAEKTINQLGHGNYNMLFGHYRALVKPDEAAEFWKLTPGTVRTYHSKKVGEAEVVKSNGLQTLKASVCK